MSKHCYGLGGAPDIKTFVRIQTKKLKECEQTFKSVFDFVFLLEDNIMAEHTDGNRIFRVTYGECKKRIEEISGSFPDKLGNLPKNSVIGLYMDNRIEWIQIFWAILRSGYVPLLMNKRLGKKFLEEVLEKNNVCAVISDDAVFNVPTFDYNEICNGGNKNKADAADWADEIIFMTSGTSAKIKLCVYSGRKICEQIYNTEKIVAKSKEIQAHTDGMIKQLTFLPFYHVFGFLACYMWFAFFARTFVFLRNYHSDTILKTVRKHKVTHIFAVPMLWTKIESTAMKTIAQRGEKINKKFNRALALSQKLHNTCFGSSFAKLAFREVRENIFGDSVRFMISGGGNIPARTLAFFNGIGYRLVNGYGMTETGITSVQLSSKPRIINTASVGEPFDSVEYKTIEGELAVKGSSMASYIITDGKKRRISDNEWFMTEDVAEQIDGQWYLNGRKDDMIVNSSGENIRPELIENSINAADAECVLLGIPSQDGTVRSQLIVSVSGNRRLSEISDEIVSQLKENDMYRQVEDIRITRSPLIRGSEYKLNRRRIKDDIINGRIRFEDDKKHSDSDETADSLKQKIIAAFEKVLGQKLTPQQYNANFFYELEGTSLSYFELVEEIKQVSGVNLLADGNTVFYSVNDVYEHLSETIIKV